MTVTRTIVNARYDDTVRVTEKTVDTDAPMVAQGQQAALADGTEWKFDGTSGDAVTKSFKKRVTMSTGAATLDLTALVDATLSSNIDMTGLKLKMLRLKVPSTNANSVTVAPGASNGYTGWVGSGGVTLSPKDSFSKVCHGGIAVDGTHKTIDITGTGSQVIDVVMLFGT